MLHIAAGKKRLLAALLWTGILFPARGTDAVLQDSIEHYLAHVQYPKQHIAVVVKEIAAIEPMVACNADESLNPASVVKLLTAAVAFEQLGAAYHFSTDVYFDGTYDSDSGIVYGNMYLQGGGDPGLTPERLWLFVQELHLRGVREIRGSIIVDDSFFDSVTTGPGFNEDSTSRAYQPIIGALGGNYGSLAIYHRSGTTVGSPVYIELFPEIPGMQVQSTAKTGEAGSWNTLSIITRNSRSGTQVIAQGMRPLDLASSVLYRKLWRSWEPCAGAFAALCEASGITVNGPVVQSVVPPELRKKPPFMRFASEPLATIINKMLKNSSNYIAEMLFKTVAIADDSLPGSWKQGAAVVRAWWRAKNLPDTLVVCNGSGMGDGNRLSANQITALLEYVWKSGVYFPEYLSALPVAGVDGTLAARFKKSVVQGVVRAKTGTLLMYGVSTLAGYFTVEQKKYVFAIFCNGVRRPYNAWVVQRRILEMVYVHEQEKCVAVP